MEAEDANSWDGEEEHGIQEHGVQEREQGLAKQSQESPKESHRSNKSSDSAEDDSAEDDRDEDDSDEDNSDGGDSDEDDSDEDDSDEVDSDEDDSNGNATTSVVQEGADSQRDKLNSASHSESGKRSFSSTGNSALVFEDGMKPNQKQISITSSEESDLKRNEDLGVREPNHISDIDADPHDGFSSIPEFERWTMDQTGTSPNSWKQHLDYIIEIFLAGGHRWSGSLKEAIDLIHEGEQKKLQITFSEMRHATLRNVEANGSAQGSEYRDAGENAGVDDEFDGDDDDPLSYTSGSDEDDLPYEGGPQFSSLGIEKMMRMLARWRQGLNLESCHSARVAALTVLQAGPEVLDILEPLAEYWSMQLVHSSELCEQLINSWLGELWAAMLCVYTASLHTEVRVEERITEVGLQLMQEPEESSRTLCDSVVYITDLITEPDQVRADMKASLSRFFNDKRLVRGALLALCKPFASSVADLEQINRAICNRDPISISIHDKGSLVELISTGGISSNSQRRMGTEDRAICLAVLDHLTGKVTENSLECQILRAVALTFGSGASLDAEVSRERAQQDELEDAVVRVEDSLSMFRDEMAVVLASASQLVLHAATTGNEISQIRNHD